MNTLHDPEYMRAERDFLINKTKEAENFLLNRPTSFGKIPFNIKRNVEITLAYHLSDKSLKEVGEDFNISPERVRQIIAKQLRILRWYIKFGSKL